MKNKRRRLKAYWRKFKHLKRKDKVYVEKIMILVSVLFMVLMIGTAAIIYVSAKNIHISHWSQDNRRDEKKYVQYVKEKEAKILVADEVKNLEEEAQLLARVVNAEAGGESREAQIAVASVILNRVESDRFPNSIEAVIYQEGQYECVTNGAINKEPTEMAVESAYFVYQNGSQIPCEVLYQAEFTQGSGVWAEIDGEFFCYE